MGYYHETPADELFDPTLYAILEQLGELGTLVVCSAGNDATSRPSFPAAFAPWSDGAGPVSVSATGLPVVSVGALNPNLESDALFTNTGPWVRTYVPGASVMSTHPPFQGGYEPVARTQAYGRWRASIDPDDFRGGFAVWSGTSFAAPLFAGLLARELVGLLPAGPGDDSAEEAVRRGWTVVERTTSIRA
jgi:subtilisin family serine protease